MGVNIGWIFGSVAGFSVVWSYFFFPELKVRKTFASELDPR
jgi:SP family sugar:H+ symporter-like MFS transporter